MLMHRVTFSTPARVSLDAAGVLTEGAAETAGEIPKIPAHSLFLLLLPHPFFKMNKNVKAVGGWGGGGGGGSRCCHKAFITS